MAYINGGGSLDPRFSIHLKVQILVRLDTDACGLRGHFVSHQGQELGSGTNEPHAQGVGQEDDIDESIVRGALTGQSRPTRVGGYI